MNKRIITHFSRMVALVIGALFLMVNTTVAATDEVRIWNSVDDVNEFNKSVKVGETTDKFFTYKLNGITETSHIWSSSDTNILKVNGTGKTISVTGVKEGYAKLLLQIKADNGKTYEDYTNISVYTDLDEDGFAKTKTTVTRAATSTTGNRNVRGDVPRGTKFKIIGKCSNYYRIIADYTFDDEQNHSYGYVLKKDVIIPTKQISVPEKDVVLKVGDKKKITPIIKPDLATETALTWGVQYKSVASVTDNTVVGKSKGATKITITTKDNKSCNFMTSVYKPIADVKGYMKESDSLFSGAYPTADSIMNLVKNDNITIIGDAGNYYYVKLKEKYGFVNKKKVEIPVTSIKILDKEIEVKEKRKRSVKVAVSPSIATEKTFSWKVGNNSIATVSNKGVITAKLAGNTIVSVSTKLGASASQKLNVPKPKKHKWVKIKDVKESGANKMQGMTGYKDNIYFFKIKKTKKGSEGKTKYAVLYKAKIKKGGKIGNIKKLKKYDKPGKSNNVVGHANGMTAVYDKKNKKVVLYVAPIGEQKGKITRISVKYNKKKKKYVVSDSKLIKCTGRDMEDKSYSSIAAWKYNNEQFFIIRNECNNFVCKEKYGKMIAVYDFEIPKPYEPNDKNKTRGQGTACAIKDDIYYYVNSFAYGKDYINKKKYRRISYVFRYRLSIKNNDIERKALKSYKFIATKKHVKAKKKKRNLMRFEMEDLYIYGKRAYLNSEGGDNCLDLIGKFIR